MPDRANEEDIETDVRTVDSPSVSPVNSKTELVGSSQSSRIFFYPLVIAFAIGSSHCIDFGAGLFRHGGVIFLVQFLLAVIFIGCPLFLLETALAQFSSTAALLQLQRAVPLFGGLVSSMAFLICLRVSVQYVWLGHTASLAVLSFQGLGTSGTPWSSCNGLPSDCFDSSVALTCYKNSSYEDKCIRQYSALVQSRTSNERKTPFVSFSEATVFNSPHLTADFHGPDNVSWICVLLVWIGIAVSALWLDRWISYSATVVCVLSVLYYVLHFVLGLTLEHSLTGLKYLVSPHWHSLYSFEAWTEATAHAVFALNLAHGGIAHIASRRSFSSPLGRDTLIISGCVVLFYLLVSLTTFLYAGHLAERTFPDIPQQERLKLLLEKRLYSLHFVYLDTVSSWRAGWFWSLLHFLVEFGRSFQLTMTLLWTLLGMFWDQRLLHSGEDAQYRWVVTSSLLLGGALVAAPFAIPGGFVHLMVIDYFSDHLTLLIGFFQLLAVAVFYRAKRLTINMETMSPSWSFVKHFYCINWSVVTPAAILTCILMSIISAIVAPKPLPDLLSLLGWLLVLIGMASALLFPLKKTNKGGRKMLTEPTAEWGPLLEQDRRATIKMERTIRVR